MLHLTSLKLILGMMKLKNIYIELEDFTIDFDFCVAKRLAFDTWLGPTYRNFCQWSTVPLHKVHLRTLQNINENYALHQSHNTQNMLLKETFNYKKIELLKFALKIVKKFQRELP